MLPLGIVESSVAYMLTARQATCISGGVGLSSGEGNVVVAVPVHSKYDSSRFVFDGLLPHPCPTIARHAGPSDVYVMPRRMFASWHANADVLVL
jgi:hypothetical protein